MAVIVIERDDFVRLLQDFKEQITSEIKQSLAGIKTSATPRLLNKKEVANMLGTSQSTIDRWRDSVSDFPKPFNIDGGRPMWDAKDIQSYISKKKQEAKATEELKESQNPLRSA